MRYDKSTSSCPLCTTPDARLFHQTKDRIYYRCSTCQLTFVPTMKLPTSRQEKTRYLTHRNDPHNEGYCAFLSRLTDILIPHLPPHAQGLDYGTGPGPVLPRMMEQRGFVMYTYDPYFAPNPRAFEKRYDFITCTEVVEHFHHPRAEFVRFASLLNNDGRLGVTTAMLDDDNAFPNWHYHRDSTHVCFYKKETFQWIADWLGWQVEFPTKDIAIFKVQLP